MKNIVLFTGIIFLHLNLILAFPYAKENAQYTGGVATSTGPVASSTYNNNAQTWPAYSTASYSNVNGNQGVAGTSTANDLLNTNWYANNAAVTNTKPGWQQPISTGVISQTNTPWTYNTNYNSGINNQATSTSNSYNGYNSGIAAGSSAYASSWDNANYGTQSTSYPYNKNPNILDNTGYVNAGAQTNAFSNTGNTNYIAHSYPGSSTNVPGYTSSSVQTASTGLIQGNNADYSTAASSASAYQGWSQDQSTSSAIAQSTSLAIANTVSNPQQGLIQDIPNIAPPIEEEVYEVWHEDGTIEYIKSYEEMLQKYPDYVLLSNPEVMPQAQTLVNNQASNLNNNVPIPTYDTVQSPSTNTLSQVQTAASTTINDLPSNNQQSAATNTMSQVLLPNLEVIPQVQTLVNNQASNSNNNVPIPTYGTVQSPSTNTLSQVQTAASTTINDLPSNNQQSAATNTISQVLLPNLEVMPQVQTLVNNQASNSNNNVPIPTYGTVQSPSTNTLSQVQTAASTTINDLPSNNQQSAATNTMSQVLLPNLEVMPQVQTLVNNQASNSNNNVPIPTNGTVQSPSTNTLSQVKTAASTTINDLPSNNQQSVATNTISQVLLPNPEVMPQTQTLVNSEASNLNNNVPITSYSSIQSASTNTMHQVQSTASTTKNDLPSNGLHSVPTNTLSQAQAVLNNKPSNFINNNVPITSYDNVQSASTNTLPQVQTAASATSAAISTMSQAQLTESTFASNGFVQNRSDTSQTTTNNLPLSVAANSLNNLSPAPQSNAPIVGSSIVKAPVMTSVEYLIPIDSNDTLNHEVKSRTGNTETPASSTQTKKSNKENISNNKATLTNKVSLSNFPSEVLTVSPNQPKPYNKMQSTPSPINTKNKTSLNKIDKAETKVPESVLNVATYPDKEKIGEKSPKENKIIQNKLSNDKIEMTGNTFATKENILTKTINSKAAPSTTAESSKIITQSEKLSANSPIVSQIDSKAETDLIVLDEKEKQKGVNNFVRSDLRDQLNRTSETDENTAEFGISHELDSLEKEYLEFAKKNPDILTYENEKDKNLAESDNDTSISTDESKTHPTSENQTTKAEKVNNKNTNETGDNKTRDKSFKNVAKNAGSSTENLKEDKNETQIQQDKIKTEKSVSDSTYEVDNKNSEKANAKNEILPSGNIKREKFDTNLLNLTRNSRAKLEEDKKGSSINQEEIFAESKILSSVSTDDIEKNTTTQPEIVNAEDLNVADTKKTGNDITQVNQNYEDSSSRSMDKSKEDVNESEIQQEEFETKETELVLAFENLIKNVDPINSEITSDMISGKNDKKNIRDNTVKSKESEMESQIKEGKIVTESENITSTDEHIEDTKETGNNITQEEIDKNYVNLSSTSTEKSKEERNESQIQQEKYSTSETQNEDAGNNISESILQDNAELENSSSSENNKIEKRIKSDSLETVYISEITSEKSDKEPSKGLIDETNTNESQDDTNESQDDTNESQDDTNESQDDTNESQDNTNESQDDTNESQDNTSKSQGDTNKSQDDTNESQDDTNESQDDTNESQDDTTESEDDTNLREISEVDVEVSEKTITSEFNVIDDADTSELDVAEESAEDIGPTADQIIEMLQNFNGQKPVVWFKTSDTEFLQKLLNEEDEWDYIHFFNVKSTI